MATFDFISHRAEVIAELRDSIQRGLEVVGLQAEGYAKEELTRQGAVDTGRLRNSVSHDHDENTAYIGTNVEYAPYIEMGTVKMKARPYLRPAAQDHVDEYKQIILNELKK